MTTFLNKIIYFKNPIPALMDLVFDQIKQLFHIKENSPLDRLLRAKTLSALIFYFDFAMFTVCYFIASTNAYNNQHKAFKHFILAAERRCTSIALFNTIFLCDYALYQIVFLLVFGYFFHLSYLKTKTRMIYQSFILIISGKNTRWSMVCATELISSLGALAIAAYMYLSDITQASYFGQETGRFDLGFNHPNVLGRILMVMGLSYLSLRYEIRKKRNPSGRNTSLHLVDYLLVVILCIVTYIWPNCRTAVIVLALALIIYLVASFFGSTLASNLLVRIITIALAPIAFVGSFLCAKYYDEANPFLRLLNKVLSDRLVYGKRYLDKYEHTWFGQKIKMVSFNTSGATGKTVMLLDSAYLKLYICFGILCSIFLLTMIMLTAYYALKENNWGMLAGIICFAFYGASETYFLYVYFNFYLIIFSYFSIHRKRARLENS